MGWKGARLGARRADHTSPTLFSFPSHLSPTPPPPSPAKPPCAAPTPTQAPATPAPTPTGARPRDRLAAALAAVVLTLTPVTALPPPASAVLNSPNSRVARTADAALRRSVPAVNADVRGVQDALEGVAFSLRIPQRKPWADMAASVDAAIVVLTDEDRATAGAPDRAAAAAIAADVREGLSRVRGAIDARDADVTSRRLAAVLADVARLEVAQAPGLPYALPRDVGGLTRLTGRAVVELTLKRGRGSPPFQPADGPPSTTATLQVTVDGYSAPITAGAFVSNVVKGEYSGTPVTKTATALLAGAGVRPGATLPLEVLPAGSFEPIYRSPLEVSSGEMPALPLSVYGAVAMARPPGAPLSEVSAGEFFVFLFNRQQAGLGGLAFEEGEFSVLGYVTKGAAVLDQVAAGDSIAAARVVEGADRLVVPGAAE